MNTESILKDLSVLRTFTERFNRNTPMKTAVYAKGGQLTTSTYEQWMLVAPEDDDIRLMRPMDIDKLIGALKNVPKGTDIRFTPGDDRVLVELPSGSESIPYVGAYVDVPPLPSGIPFPRRAPLEIRADALEYCSRAMSTELVRYALQSVLIDGENGKLVASDGKVLHVRPFRCEKKFPRLILPSKAVLGLIAAQKREGLQPIRKLALPKAIAITDAKTGKVSYAKDKPPDYVWLHVGRFEIYSKLYDGSFPDYTKVFPKSYSWTLRLRAPELRGILRDFNGGHDSYCRLIFKLAGDSLTIAFSRKKDRECDEVCSERRMKIMRFTGDRRYFENFSFNPKYLLNASWNDYEMVLQGNKPDVAILVDGTALVMPLSGHDGLPATLQKLGDLPKDGTIRSVRPDASSSWNLKTNTQKKEDLVEPKYARRGKTKLEARIVSHARKTPAVQVPHDPPPVEIGRGMMGGTIRPIDENPIITQTNTAEVTKIVIEKSMPPQAPPAAVVPAAAPAAAKKPIADMEFNLFS